MKEIAPGTVIDGRYSIESPLGRGGFAAVYKAHHQRLNKTVALKVLDLPDVPMDVQPFVQRFMREAQVSARIEHSNIVTVYDYGVIEGTSQPYIAMEFLNGHDLDDELKLNGGMDPDRMVRLFIPMLEALGVAHSNGVVHKDLKPSNLFMVRPGTRSEKLVVLDFGIARFFTEEDSRLTQTGGFSGTPAYLAPEYIEKQIVSPRLDVYQMGLILLEAMTGRPAVQADNAMAYMLAHCSGDVKYPQGLFGTELGTAIRRATQRDPEQRFGDAHEFAEALRGINVQGIAVTSQIASASEVEEMGTAETLMGATPSGAHTFPGSPAETPLPPPDPGVPAGFKIAVVVLLVAIVSVGFFAAYKFSERSIEPEEVKKEPVEIATNTPVIVVPEEEPEEVEEPPEVEEEPVLHTVGIDSNPRAKVFIDGKLVGFTPRKHQFEAGNSVVVRLEAKGYEPIEETVDKNQNLVKELTPVASKRPKYRPKKPEKKPIGNKPDKPKEEKKTTHSFVD